MRRQSVFSGGAIFLLLLFAVAALYLTAPHAGQFWWSDAPRHALDGVFLRDFFADLPLRRPMPWAVEYYLHYPALTIMFYPPGLALVEAAFFGVFGVSPESAILTAIAFCASLAAACYCLARRWLPPFQACAVALLLIGLPEVARWGRQSMTDVPAFSFLVWSAYLFMLYQETGKPARLYGALFVFLLGLYTKQGIIFFLPAALIVLWMERGRSLLRDRHFWIGGVLLVIGLVPLLVMTLKFGQGNLQSVAGIEDSKVSRLSLAGWIYYAQLLPRQLGWAPLMAALFYCVMAALRKEWRPRFPAFPLLLLWFVLGYLFFSAIDLKDGRLDLYILLTPALFAILLFHHALETRWANAVALAFALCCFGYTMWAAPVPEVDGYVEAARWVADNTPANAIGVFSGQRDGSFIFNLRTLDPDRQRTIIRADKLFLKISIRRELGVEQKTISVADVATTLDRYGVAYVVAERDFWTDLTAMQVFQDALQSSHFALAKTIEVTSNVNHQDRELRIYRNLDPITQKPEKLIVDLPIIGRQLEGAVGDSGEH